MFRSYDAGRGAGMIIDARSLQEGALIDTDICIVGAGVVGVSLAREFIGKKLRVCLVEAGGTGPDKATQSLLWGECSGHPYFPLDTARTCGFGGSSNRWSVGIGDSRLGVRLRPLDPIDFEARDWVSYSGWPFSKSHLDPYYERAHAVCRIGPYRYDVSDWEEEGKPRLPLSGDRVETSIFQFGPRSPFCREYREEIEHADNITSYIHANALEVETAKTTQTVSSILFGCLNGKRFRISAKLFILAAGAIEIPRLMLLSNKSWRDGLGNQHDIVGRFFMEHPHLWSGRLISPLSNIRKLTALYRIHAAEQIPIMAKLTLSPDVLRREQLLNYSVSLHLRPSGNRGNITTSWPVVSWPLLGTDTPEQSSAAVCSSKTGKPPGLLNGMENPARSVYRMLRGQAGRVYHSFRRNRDTAIFDLNHMTEQEPNPESRVTLINECDMLGRRRVRLHWKLTALDIRSIIRAQEIIGEEFKRAGLGSLEMRMKDETPPPDLEGGWHHMGTTRMHGDPKKGVVDEQCRVHGVSNLFIAGPSVFPTCGYANPVLTSVALAVRLADHVKQVMSDGPNI